jgi:hypothetical protein
MPPTLALFSDLPGNLTGLVWLLQLGLIVHVVRTGRPYWWIMILLFAPGLGAVVYLLLEVVPGLPKGGGAFNWKPRSLRIRDLRRELEESDIVKIRLALAEELLAAGQAAEAQQVADEALRGVFKEDPHTLTAVARFRLEAGKPAEALAALDAVDTHRDRMLDLRVAVLRGRAWVAAGKDAEAQPLLRSLLSRHPGEEPRYFLALSLQKTGHAEEAKAIFEDIRKKFRRAGRGWRRAERPWFDQASERLKEMRK